MSDQITMLAGTRRFRVLPFCLVLVAACSTAEDESAQEPEAPEPAESSADHDLEVARARLLAAHSLDELREAVDTIVALDADVLAPEMVQVLAGRAWKKGSEALFEVLSGGRAAVRPPEWGAARIVCSGLGDIAGPRSIRALGSIRSPWTSDFAAKELDRIAASTRSATVRFRARLERARLRGFLFPPPGDELSLVEVEEYARIAAALPDARYVTKLADYARAHHKRRLGEWDRSALDAIAAAFRKLGAVDEAEEVEAVVARSRKSSATPSESGG